MALPTIDSTQGILGYYAYETFAFQAAGYGGTGSQDQILFWQASLPPGLAINDPPEKAVAGSASTGLFTCADHGFSNGDMVYFPVTSDGSGIAVLNSFYVRDVTTDTFALAMTPSSPAFGIYSDMTGQIRKCGTSLITGSVSIPGNYVIGLRAFNSFGGSGISYFTLGIERGDGSESVAGSSDTGIDVNIDVVTREVSLAAVAAGPLFLVKENDTVILNIRFKKTGVSLDPDPTEINIAFKELETEAAILTAGGAVTTAWTKAGSGSSAVCRLPVTVEGAGIATALANYESDAGTQFDALCEIEWKQALEPPIGGISELVASTKTFKVTIARDLVA